MHRRRGLSTLEGGVLLPAVLSLLLATVTISLNQAQKGLDVGTRWGLARTQDRSPRLGGPWMFCTRPSTFVRRREGFPQLVKARTL